MKKLESLNSSLFNSYNSPIGPLSPNPQYCTIATCRNNKEDEFSDSWGTHDSSMAYGGYADLGGDYCYEFHVVSGSKVGSMNWNRRR